MPKSTADTLKQIQKQGLSVSIVKQSSSTSSLPPESPGAKDLKPKQIVSIDKTPKLPTRTSVVTENKSIVSQARSMPNTLSPGGQTPNSSHFQDNKAAASINKTMVPISTSSGQAWCDSSVIDSKIKAGLQAAQSQAAENKQLNFTGRLSQSQVVFSDGKSQTPKGSPIVTEAGKGQSRVSQGPRQPSSNASGRNLQGNLGSPPSVNSDKHSLNIFDNIRNTQQRIVSETNQTKLVTNNKVGDVTLPTQLRVSQIMKGTPAERINMPQTKPEQSSNMFRVSLGERSPCTVDEKTFVKAKLVNKALPQNIILSKNLTPVQMKKQQQNTSVISEQKGISQVIKIASLSSDNSQRQSFENIEVTPGKIVMSSPRATPKRAQVARPLTSTPVPKKKCVKRISPNATENISEVNPRTPKGIEMQGRGLTITPVNTTTTSKVTNRTATATESTADSTYVVMCPRCGKYSFHFDHCDHCSAVLPENQQRFRLKKVVKNNEPTGVVTEKIITTSTIEKKIVYHFTEGAGDQNYHYHQSMQKNVVFETSSPLRGGRGRGKTRRKAEPVCYTLSSDDEEPPVVFHQMQGASMHSPPVYQHVESEGSKSDHSEDFLQNEMHDEQQEESDDQGFPGVMDINPNIEEEEPEEEMEYEGEEIEEEEEENFEEEEEEMGEAEDGEEEFALSGMAATDHPLKCRSIRVGSYKVHPPPATPYLPVMLSERKLMFKAPILNDPEKTVCIYVQSDDILLCKIHFGRCLPIMFIYTTPKFGETVRTALHMTPGAQYFDPLSKDDKSQKLTFLIENMTEEQKTFLRSNFPGPKKVEEIDQKEANEILVKSTPSQPSMLIRPEPASVSPVVSNESRLPHISISNQISITPVPIVAAKVIPKPPPPIAVVKLLTYPAPPMTGGIAITNEDLYCLNEGEFLNDAIIDMYLKYLFYEKLSPYYQERTHIFSSFFFPRLTSKTERPRSSDDVNKTMPVRRHNQVKTWTRHVDIFSKDYIIIPVNQNVHWFLAIICFPGRVPDAPAETKLNDSVSSTISTSEQEHKVTIKEITSNGEDDSPNPDENSMNSNASSPYEVEEPPDSDEGGTEIPDTTTTSDGKQRKEMPCICIFDSLSGPSRYRIATVLREYLEMEWKSKKGTKKVFNKNTMQGFAMKCPQQTNFSDCGVYLLQYVESFFENPIPFCNPMPDLTEWFTEEKVNRKRQQLKDLILNLQKKQEVALARKKQNSSQHSDNR